MMRLLDTGNVTVDERSARADVCALAVMAKAPRVGRVKTRLSPPLTPEQASGLSVCFLRDTMQNLAAVAESGVAAGTVAYTPLGDEAAFEGLLPPNFAMVAQRGTDFGERLLYAARDILACGYGSVCLIDGDSPTVPRAAYEQAVAALRQPGDRIVVGPAADGGYYLIGMKHPHATVFEGISWSTNTVYAETLVRARAAGINVVETPLWYDVDDRATLDILEAELLAGIAPGFATTPGYEAPHTRKFLLEMEPAFDQVAADALRSPDSRDSDEREPGAPPLSEHE